MKLAETQHGMAWHCMASALHSSLHNRPKVKCNRPKEKCIFVPLQMAIMCCHDEWDKCCTYKVKHKKAYIVASAQAFHPSAHPS